MKLMNDFNRSYCININISYNITITITININKFK